MFDTSEIWAKVLKACRENHEKVLFSVCGDICDVEFTRDFVVVTAPNDTAFMILKKYQTTLVKYAGGGYIKIDPPVKVQSRAGTIEKLKELFGDKLVVR